MANLDIDLTPNTSNLSVTLQQSSGGGTSDYTDLTNKPKINNVELNGNKTTSQLGINIPTKTSDLTNDSGFLTQHQDITGKQDVLSAGANITITGTTISAIDTKNYNDLTNKPTIPTYTSQLTNDSGYLTQHQDISNKQDRLTAGDNIHITNNIISATDTKNYNDLINKPTIPSKTSDLTNDSGFLTSHQDISNKQDKLTAGNNITINNNTISATDTTYTAGSGIDITDNIITATGGGGGGTSDYLQLSNKPQINSITLSGNKTLSELSIQHELTAGDNIDITNSNVISATVPTKTSDLTNDSGFLTSHQDITGKADLSYVNNQLATKQDTLTAGANITIVDNVISASGVSSYNDLTNKPTINSVALSGNKTTADLGISYNDLTNKPTIPTVPTNISAFTNDSGYITSSYHDNTKQDTLTAGANINIASGVISATDTTYTAGSGISITNNVISATGGGGGGSDIATDTLNNKLESYVLRGEVVDLTVLNTLLENQINGV